MNEAEADLFGRAVADGELLIPGWLPCSSPVPDAYRDWCRRNGRPYRERESATLAEWRLLKPPVETLAPAPKSEPAAHVPPPPEACPDCRHAPFDRRQMCCWRCDHRRCSGCGKLTGSAFLELCVCCDVKT